jgi:hypothetical protein
MRVRVVDNWLGFHTTMFCGGVARGIDEGWVGGGDW